MNSKTTADCCYNFFNPMNMKHCAVYTDTFYKFIYKSLVKPFAIQHKYKKILIKCHLAIPQFCWFHYTWPRRRFATLPACFRSGLVQLIEELRNQGYLQPYSRIQILFLDKQRNFKHIIKYIHRVEIEIEWNYLQIYPQS